MQGLKTLTLSSGNKHAISLPLVLHSLRQLNPDFALETLTISGISEEQVSKYAWEKVLKVSIFPTVQPQGGTLTDLTVESSNRSPCHSAAPHWIPAISRNFETVPPVARIPRLHITGVLHTYRVCQSWTRPMAPKRIHERSV